MSLSETIQVSDYWIATDVEFTRLPILTSKSEASDLHPSRAMTRKRAERWLMTEFKLKTMHSYLSSPRKRGPIRCICATKLPRSRISSAYKRFMGPRLRGDDGRVGGDDSGELARSDIAALDLLGQLFHQIGNALEMRMHDERAAESI